MGKYVGGIEGSVEIDIKQAQASIRKLRTELKQLQQSYDTATEVSTSADPFSELTEKIKQYETQIVETKAKLKELKAEQKGGDSSNTLTDQIKSTEKEVRQLSSSFKALKRVEEEVSKAGSFSGASDSLTSQIAGINSKITSLKTNIKDLKSGTNTSIETPVVTTSAPSNTDEVKSNKEILLTEEQRLAVLERIKTSEQNVSDIMAQQAKTAALNYIKHVEDPNISSLSEKGMSDIEILSKIDDLRLQQSELIQKGLRLLEEEESISTATANAEIANENKKQQAINATNEVRNNTSFADADVDPYNEGITKATKSTSELQSQIAKTENSIEALKTVLANENTVDMSSSVQSIREQEIEVERLKQKWNDLKAAKQAGETVAPADLQSASQELVLARQRLDLTRQSADIQQRAAEQSSDIIESAIIEQEALLNSLNEQLASRPTVNTATPVSHTAEATSSVRSGMQGITTSTTEATSAVGRFFANFASLSMLGPQLREVGSSIASVHTTAYADDIERAERSSERTSSNFKDISRVVSGILISQAFYKALGYTEQMLSNIKDIYQLTEQMNISFSVMFKDKDMGESFTNQLKNFASVTPFTFTDVSKNARMLSAYGFQANELLPVLQKLSDASAAMGDSDSFERVTRALGQIRTKGRLMQEELRQLNEAGIRTTDILEQKLGLTADQMARIGDLKIPADTAIKALLSGISDQYSGASKLMATTTKGMANTIKDNVSLIGEQVGSGFFNFTKGIMAKFTKTVYAASQEMQQVGFGGWINNHFSPADAELIRNLAANLYLMAVRIKELFVALAPIGTQFMRWMVIMTNLVLPVLNAVNWAVANVITWFLHLNPVIQQVIGGFLAFAVIYKVIMLFSGLTTAIKTFALVAKVVIPAFRLLVGAIRALALACMQNVWVLFLTIAAGALIYFALKSDWAAGLVNKLSTALNGLFKNDPSQYFAPSQQDTKDWGKYSNNVTNATDDMNDLKDSTDEANKAAKNALASFDEVFNLNGLDDASSIDTPSTDLSGINLPDIADMNPLDVPVSADLGLDDIKLPEVGQLSDLFSDRIHDALLGAGLGAVIGAVLGGIIGGPEGAKIGAGIGALVGGLVGWFWQDFSDDIKNSITGATVGSAIGLAIGALFGQPVIGAAIGAAVGGLGGYFWNAVGASIQNVFYGAGMGALIGGIVGLCLGNPLIGAAIGASIGGLGGYFWNSFSDDLKNSAKGMGIGAVIGGIIGTIIAPGPGTAIGIAIGGGVGGIVGYFWEKLKATFTESASGGCSIIGAVIGTVFFGPIGAILGAGIGFLIGKIIDAAPEIVDGFNQWCAGIEQWWSDLFTSMGDWVNSGITSVTSFFSNIPYNIGLSLGQAMDSLATWGIQFVEWAGTSVGTTIDSIAAWFATVPYKVGESLGYALGTIARWGVDFYTWVTTEIPKDLDNFVSWFTALPGRIWTELTTLQNDINSWGTNFYTWVTTEIPKDLDNFVSWFTALPGRIATHFSQMLSDISNWGSNFNNWVQTSVAGIINNFVSWFQTLPGRIMVPLNDAWSGIKAWGSDIYNSAVSSAKDFVDGFVQGIGSLPGKVKELGKYIVQGLVDGINDAWHYFSDGVGSFKDGVLAGFRKAFDINSPSRVMKKEVGIYIGQGTIEGVDESLAGLNSVMQNIVNQATKPIQLDKVVDTKITSQDGQEATNNIENLLSGMLSNVLTSFFDNLYNGFTSLYTKLGGIETTAPTINAAVLASATSVPNVTSLPSSIAVNNASAQQIAGTQSQATSQSDIESIVQAVVQAVTGTMPTPIYAGTVIADDRSLKDLNVKLQQINNDSKRRLP